MSVHAKNFLTVENTTIAPRSSWIAERSVLLEDALVAGGHIRVRLRVHGESMLPVLWPGDVVEIASCSLEEVARDAIVLARREGRFFLHRFVSRCEPNSFLLRGDSMPAPDPPYASCALLGRLVSGRTSGAFGVKSSRALGMLLCHCDWARRIALRLHGWRKGSAHALRNSASATNQGAL